jgi:RimJ/RimL family protein N-acetyltransferase
MNPSATPPAYRLITPRLLLRCWNPADATLLKEAIDTSLDHLRPWMPWAADEPQELPAKVQLLRSFRGRFDLDTDYVYGIFNLEQTQVLGGAGLHTRIGPGALEIGYWIRASQINQGLATETAAALTRVAFEIHQVHRLEIHCDPANTRSAAVPRKLGYRHEAILRRRIPTRDGAYRDSMIWTLLRDEYPATPAAACRLQAFDAMDLGIL